MDWTEMTPEERAVYRQKFLDSLLQRFGIAPVELLEPVPPRHPLTGEPIGRPNDAYYTGPYGNNPYIPLALRMPPMPSREEWEQWEQRMKMKGSCDPLG
jgi:hypothetical protein